MINQNFDSIDNIYDFYQALSELKLDKCDECEIDKLYKKLLTLFPNGGKLYKYRNFVGKHFSYTYDGLKNGYLFLSQASKMNDELDTSLHFSSTPKDEVLKFLRKNSSSFYKKHIFEFLTKKFGIAVQRAQFLADHLVDNKIFGKQKGTQFLQANGLFNNQIAFLNSYLKRIRFEEIADAFQQFNNDIQNNIRLYCMSARNDLDSLWAYYGNNNQGYCIEYDFSKTLLLTTDSIKTKKVLLNLCAVRYSETKDPFSIESILNVLYLDNSNFHNTNCEITKHLLYKHISWRHEEEWRILISIPDANNGAPCSLPIDLVSSIYIDEKMVNPKSGKQKTNVAKLLRLAKQRKWNVYLRVLDTSLGIHSFIPYNID